MKKITKLRNTIFAISMSVLLSIGSTSSYSKSNFEQLSNADSNSEEFSSLSEHKYADLLSTDEKKSKVIEAEVAVPEINDKSSNLINIFDKDLKNIYSSKIIYDETFQRKVTRVITDNSLFDFDENGIIVEYKNFDDYSIVDKNRHDYIEDEKIPEIEYKIHSEEIEDIKFKIEASFDSNDYKLIDCSNGTEGVWILTWCKEYENELINPYETVNVVVDAKDGSIMLYGRNDTEPNTLKPTIPKDKISLLLREIIEKNNINISSIRLTFYKDINKHEDYARLCYEAIMDNNTSIIIDASDGEILSSNNWFYIQARSMITFPEEVYIENENNVLAAYISSLAENAFSELGYHQDYGTVYWHFYQTDIDWILSRPDMYALYLNCHGRYGYGWSHLFDPGYWSLDVNSSTDFGNWRFVFLNACESSKGNILANAFHCTDSGECFVGWNVVANGPMATYFCTLFFPRLGTMSVHSDVVTSLWEARNNGYNDPMHYDEYGNIVGNICDPGFNGDVNYYGWAW